MTGRVKRPARVMFTIDSLLSSGGLERVLTTRCNYLATDPNIEVTLVTLDPVDMPPFFSLDERVRLIALNIPVDRRQSLFAPRNLRLALCYGRLLSKQLSSILPDLVVNCDHNYSTYLLPILVRNKTRLLHEHHSTRSQLFRSGWRWASLDILRRLVEKRFDARLFLNPLEGKLSGFADPVVLPNPVESKGAPIAGSRDQVVIAAGRMYEVKGFDRLIEIWAAVSAQFPEWKLKIFGSGSDAYRASLVRQAERLGLSDRVEVIPATNDLEREMRGASIYAMTSRMEAFPMVLLEAMRAELPIVCYDCPTGPKAIIENGRTGLLVTDGNASDFADALISLMSNPTLRQRLAVAARGEVTRYSMTAIGNQWKSWIIEARDGCAMSRPAFNASSSDGNTGR